ncbi:MAG: hypothetical protein AW09_000697 [Candidatus Accumulibacter phosphatis]|uniref:Uncharacterized protein n=1 Tax=Candidatus Accumulibacter phosphatis TaxID=327160 RepID=A0A080M154_9PROT|nr:MAG: hypothetical protein AW09_000697 [Candidatus Accumulibacter phosphatis]
MVGYRNAVGLNHGLASRRTDIPSQVSFHIDLCLIVPVRRIPKSDAHVVNPVGQVGEEGGIPDDDAVTRQICHNGTGSVKGPDDSGTCCLPAITLGCIVEC